MPIPTPRKGQTKQEFVDSCMADKAMNREYKNRDRRFAICNSQWENKDKKK